MQIDESPDSDEAPPLRSSPSQGVVQSGGHFKFGILKRANWRCCYITILIKSGSWSTLVTGWWLQVFMFYSGESKLKYYTRVQFWGTLYLFLVSFSTLCYSTTMRDNYCTFYFKDGGFHTKQVIISWNNVYYSRWHYIRINIYYLMK